MKTIGEYFKNNQTIAGLMFSEPEEVASYNSSNFIYEDNGYLYLLGETGKVEYMISTKTPIQENEEGFVMSNKFYPSPITVKVFFGGATL